MKYRRDEVRRHDEAPAEGKGVRDSNLHRGSRHGPQRSGQCGLADGPEPLTLLIFENRNGYSFVKATAAELSRPNDGIVRDLGLAAAISPTSAGGAGAV